MNGFVIHSVPGSPFDRAPNIRQWLDGMNARPSMRATTWERVAAMAKAA